MREESNHVEILAIGKTCDDITRDFVNMIHPPHFERAFFFALGRLQVGLFFPFCLVGAADGVCGLFASRLGI